MAAKDRPKFRTRDAARAMRVVDGRKPTYYAEYRFSNGRQFLKRDMPGPKPQNS